MTKRTKILLLFGGILLAVALVVAAVVYFAVLRPKWENQKEQARLVAEYRQNKYDAYQQENQKYGDYEVDVAFLGDSLTDGYDLPRYFPQYTVVNRGIGGDTTYDLQNRLALSAYELKPKVLVMLIGGNNLDTMFENYEEILKGIQINLPQTKVILVSLTAMGGDWGHKNQLAAYNNVKIKKLADKYGFTYVDLFTPLFDETTGEIYAEYTNDGAHLTDKGYQVFTDAVTPAIELLLESKVE